MHRELRRRGDSALDHVRVVTYEQIRDGKLLPGHTYVFADIERLSRRQLALAGRIWRALADADVPTRLLNHPLRVRRRYDLLAELHARRVNNFRAHRVTELRRPRFPVFLRRENDHGGNLTGLLWSHDEILDAVSRRGGLKPIRRLLAVEFCDTADSDGHYARYGAYIVGDRIIPSQIYFSRDWMIKQKTSTAPTAAQLDQVSKYVETNPHEGWLREVFGLANVDYGRIDYAFEGSCPRVWEINTNPEPFGDACAPSQLPYEYLGADRLATALRAIDICGDTDGPATGGHFGSPPILVRGDRWTAKAGAVRQWWAKRLRRLRKRMSRVLRPLRSVRKRLRLRRRVRRARRLGRTLGLRALLPALWRLQSRPPPRA